ncbi:hypothetical protein EOD41_03360 [Mucilaginibacter limnophilus]|uniref:DUF6377 domain-containing protein n=1 Tax=Mucilaginibacter limnophilus TaxID=1932778 RepID=A0A437MZ92_9SPHI|nr:DUF6377 domain-containing protein [Mucilaginibacter limnophilus]RVU02985.1 hypothetical protein EOD41_03360 [Mucilaginibacter limnophilus]
MRRKISAIIFCLISVIHTYANTPKTDSLWLLLKAELKKGTSYIQRKEQKIRLIKQQLEKIPDDNFNPRFQLLSHLFDEYSSFRFDSAITSVHRMIAISKRFNEKQHLIKSQMAYATVLMKSGFYKEAFDAVAEVDTNQLSTRTEHDYLVLRALLYAEISAYNNDAYFAKRYHEASEEDFKRAAQIINVDELERTINLAFLPTGDKKKPTAEFYYNYLLSRKLSEHQIAIIATRISYAYDNYDKLLLLTLAAINDIRSATKETFAIFLLGQELFQHNRNNDAYICMQEALGNAAFFGTRNRAAQIESVLPLIASRLIEEKQHEKDMLWIGIVIFLFVAVVLVFQLVLFRKQMIRIKMNDRIIQEKNTELEDVNGKLWESSRIKEELIGLFFKTCSSYIETLDKVIRKAQHNIKLGKYQDATRVLGNVHIQTEKNQLFSTLDRVFLTLFPNFVASFNSLLKQEDQIWLKEGEMMTATLRIFALIRLGVTDIETIAKILDYTVNTVYTYKARIKGKALVSPDVFEQKIMEIKFTDDR